MSQKKIQILSRSVRDHTGPGSISKRNPDPKLHPFEKAREYTRALNATKLDRVFAKPFIAALDAHTDGVCVIQNVRSSLSLVASGSYNGELVLWNVNAREKIWMEDAHSGFLRGIASNCEGNLLWTCGDDKVVKMWDVKKVMDEKLVDCSLMYRDRKNKQKPVNSYVGEYPFVALDHSWSEQKFVTCGINADLWEETRNAPIHTFNWGADTMISVRFNPVETSVFGATASDRSITLFDIRTKTALKKLVLAMNSNAIAWNPMEAYHFSVANEDHNCYTYDMRRMDKALIVHKDHVSAVMSIDYSPTGREFVSGSYDRTVRIFPVVKGNLGRSTQDSKFVLSGSDDTNIRIWKAKASEKLDVLVPAEKDKLAYNEKLKSRYSHLPEIRRIAKHRHVPKPIYNAKNLKQVMSDSKKKHKDNEIKHSKPGRVQTEPAKKHNIIDVID
jgi:WD repeat and SOF domain-containing protein 1